MIKIEDFGIKIQINGYPEQIALEFETLARQVRKDLCECLGEEVGNAYYEEILGNAQKTEAEVEAEAQEVIKKNPGLMEELEKHPAMRKLKEVCGS